MRLDPWSYLQIKANGNVLPCCWHPPIGNLAKSSLEEIVLSEAAKKLRADLLAGTLGISCQNCTARRRSDVAELQSAVARYLSAPTNSPLEISQGELVEVSSGSDFDSESLVVSPRAASPLFELPSDFVGSTYLAMYPDLQAAKVDPSQHYLALGQFEGRAYKPNGQRQ